MKMTKIMNKSKVQLEDEKRNSQESPSPHSQDDSLNLEGITIGDIHIEQKVGDGTFGIVYRGFQEGCKRYVVVKFLREELVNEPDYLRLFLEEASKMAKGEHENVVRVYGTGNIEIDNKKYHYIILEWMDENLSEFLKRITPGRAEEIMREVCTGVQHIHESGFVHQDIKPGNIFLKDGKIKIGDFNLAMKMLPKKSEIISPGGTSGYRAPEITKGKLPTRRSDIYSLGCTFKEILSYCVDDDDDESIPKRWSKVISKATSQNPFGRYSSAQSMLKAIEGKMNVKKWVGMTLSPVALASIIFATIYLPGMLGDNQKQLISEADVYIQKENFKAALPLVEKAVQLNPENITYRNKLRTIYSALYMDDKSEEQQRIIQQLKSKDFP